MLVRFGEHVDFLLPILGCLHRADPVLPTHLGPPHQPDERPRPRRPPGLQRGGDRPPLRGARAGRPRREHAGGDPQRGAQGRVRFPDVAAACSRQHADGRDVHRAPDLDPLLPGHGSGDAHLPRGEKVGMRSSSLRVRLGHDNDLDLPDLVRPLDVGVVHAGRMVSVFLHLHRDFLDVLPQRRGGNPQQPFQERSPHSRGVEGAVRPQPAAHPARAAGDAAHGGDGLEAQFREVPAFEEGPPQLLPHLAEDQGKPQCSRRRLDPS
mmetsp:Transcript_51100/g.129922  ORF Transcript_51100/g.129922 Transcript_51100/m.129922 type:complete len:265 (+) Transcript_51100:378-1172(+)